MFEDNTIDIRECKHFKGEMLELLSLCKGLYTLPGCGAGGMLHILLDDNNIDDEDITYCLKECLQNPDKIESELGVTICLKYLKMSCAERRLFDLMWTGAELIQCNNCNTCDIGCLKRW